MYGGRESSPKQTIVSQRRDNHTHFQKEFVNCYCVADRAVLNRRQGADGLNRVLLYSPDPYIPGSSVSHWDTSAFANLLMEPALNGDRTHNLDIPFDLTLRFFHDIGW